MSSLETVKDIDEKTKHCVFGYIRKTQKIFPNDNIYYTIPSLVIHWILLYYHIQERFDPENCGDGCSLNDDGSVLTKSDSDYDIAFLTQTVTTGIHQWKFKVVKISPSHYSYPIWSHRPTNSRWYFPL